jgi:hypothetical protein
MAINLATKYAGKTSDLLKAKRKSEPFVNNDWDWDGVGSINVYTLTDPTMGNYDATAASNRYGTPSEVQDTVQTWTLARDRSWTKVMDKKNKQDTMAIRQPGKYLAQATKNVLVPEMDAYIFQTIATAANVANRGIIVANTATSAANAYSNYTTLNAQITDDEGAENGRISAMTPVYYNFLKQGGFVLDSESGQSMRHSGDLGEVDGNRVFVVPSGRMPSVTISAATKVVDLIISHPSVCVSPEKLVDYTLHQNAPGYSGDLLEYRHRYDAFTDTNLIKQVAFHAA